MESDLRLDSGSCQSFSCRIPSGGDGHNHQKTLFSIVTNAYFIWTSLPTKKEGLEGGELTNKLERLRLRRYSSSLSTTQIWLFISTLLSLRQANADPMVASRYITIDSMSNSITKLPLVWQWVTPPIGDDDPLRYLPKDFAWHTRPKFSVRISWSRRKTGLNISKNQVNLTRAQRIQTQWKINNNTRSERDKSHTVNPSLEWEFDLFNISDRARRGDLLCTDFTHRRLKLPNPIQWSRRL